MTTFAAAFIATWSVLLFMASLLALAVLVDAALQPEENNA